MIPEVDSQCLVVRTKRQEVQAVQRLNNNASNVRDEYSQLITVEVPKRDDRQIRAQSHGSRAEKRIPAEPFRREWPYCKTR